VAQDDAMVASPITYAEYAAGELPDVLRLQVLDFLRIVWPDGFVGPNRFRDAITRPELSWRHLIFAARDQLISHLELVRTEVDHAGASYRIVSPTGVLTYPAFRGEGWMSRLLAAAMRRIDGEDCDAGLLFCRPGLVDFYARAGWAPVPDVAVVAGPDGATWVSSESVLIRPVGERGDDLRRSLAGSTLRIADEW
jgi:GNAT superfamily N-acetyltransferase